MDPIINIFDSVAADNITFNTTVNISKNSSGYYSKKSLEILNSEEAIRRLPVVVFISILIVIGVFGNVHVLYIYSRKFSASTYRIFVITLATIDITSCCISMPFEISDELNPYMFNNEIACKMFRFLNTCLAMATALMLVVIASERYRKICKPYGNQMSEKQSKYALVGVICFTVVSTLPALYVYGYKTVEIPGRSDLNGTECTWADYVEGSAVGYAYFGWGILVILTCMVLLVMLYALVGVHLRTHTIKVQSTIRIKRKSKRRSLNSWRKSRNVRSNDSKALDGTRPESQVLNGRKSVQSDISALSAAKLNSENLSKKKVERYTKLESLTFENLENKPVEITVTDTNNFKTNKNTEEAKHGQINSPTSASTGSANELTISNEQIDNSSSRNSIFTVSDSYTRDSENETTHEYISDSESKANTVVIDPNATPEATTMSRKGGTIMRKTKTFISDREQRITKVLFTITLLFITTFLPYIVILIVYSVDETYEDKLSPTAYIVYLVALRLYLINNVANSLLYISFDLKFRKHFVNIYKKIME